MAKTVQENLEKFGGRIKKIRQALRMSQREFAEGLSLSKSFICDIEQAKSGAGYDFFFKVSKIYNVNLPYLFHGNGGMFGNDVSEKSLGDKEVGDSIETVGELLWYLDRSPLLMHTVIGFATKVLYDNVSHIKNEIEKFNSKKEI